MNKLCPEYHRCYQIGGLKILVSSDLPITDNTFDPKFEAFRIQSPVEDTDDNLVIIHHHFTFPTKNIRKSAKEVYRRPPWIIYHTNNSWVYVGIAPGVSESRPTQLAVFNKNHTRGHIYHPDKGRFQKGNLHSLTMLSTDQILLSSALSEKMGCYFHSSGTIINGKGLLFTGQSDTGKSTISRLLEKNAEVLCDDRNIVRRHDDGFRVYGTWSHGEWPVISAASAPLTAICFLEQAAENQLISVVNRREIIQHLLPRLIRPLQTRLWWNKMFDLLEQIANEIPCYVLRFNKDIGVLKLLQELAHD